MGNEINRVFLLKKYLNKNFNYDYSYNHNQEILLNVLKEFMFIVIEKHKNFNDNEIEDIILKIKSLMFKIKDKNYIYNEMSLHKKTKEYYIYKNCNTMNYIFNDLKNNNFDSDFKEFLKSNRIIEKINFIIEKLS